MWDRGSCGHDLCTSRGRRVLKKKQKQDAPKKLRRLATTKTLRPQQCQFPRGGREKMPKEEGEGVRKVSFCFVTVGDFTILHLISTTLTPVKEPISIF